MKRLLSSLLLTAVVAVPSMAQQKGITDTRNSKYAVVNSTSLDAVRWTGGFWGDRFNVFAGTSVKAMFNTWKEPRAHGWDNFLIAAGEKEGERQGPPFHDGDMYKWLEGVAAVYAVTRDPELDDIMNQFIRLIVKVQRPDGYIHTPVIAAELQKQKATASSGAEKKEYVTGTKTGTADEGAFGNRLNFETYNLGHLITAGIIHRRATGKETLFQCAIKAADFLCGFYERASDELARNAICPSHYMAINEMYRETGNPRYLELSKQLINIRGKVENGTDDNQDRIPFREQYRAMGHAVRANYLYAGVADLYAEDGEQQLKSNLDSIWNDIVTHKMYINGACGALYDGTSPDGTEYEPDLIQKVHQSYGRPYQLPHSTAHNESCANIGNMLFNWRMFLSTADARYTDLVENCFYNSILPNVSLDGLRYFYTNPLRVTHNLPYTLRWSKEREDYIELCNCCPPNTLRTLCEVQAYAYSVSADAIYVNLYGQNTLSTTIDNIGEVQLEQVSDYPWNGDITITVKQLKKGKAFAMKLRIPDWTSGATVSVNGTPVSDLQITNGYATVQRTWKKGDVVTLSLPMTTRVMEANPLVEECRGQVAVQRGPVIYCMEAQDLQGRSMDDIVLPANATFTTVETTIDGQRLVALETEAIDRSQSSWSGQLYRELSNEKKTVKIRLVPYFAWGNRGKSDMTVWIPVEF